MIQGENSMGMIKKFHDLYTQYERGYIADEEFGLGNYFSGHFVDDVIELLEDNISTIDKEDYKFIEDFCERFSDKVCPNNNECDLATLINAWHKFEDLPKQTLEKIKDDLNIIGLVEYKRTDKDYLLNHREVYDEEWEYIFNFHLDKLYDLNLEAQDLIKIIDSIEDNDVRLNVIGSLEYVIINKRNIYKNWATNDSLILYLKLKD